MCGGEGSVTIPAASPLECVSAGIWVGVSGGFLGLETVGRQSAERGADACDRGLGLQSATT